MLERNDFLVQDQEARAFVGVAEAIFKRCTLAQLKDLHAKLSTAAVIAAYYIGREETRSIETQSAK